MAMTLLCGFALVAWLIAAAARWHVEGRRRVRQEPSTSVLARDTAPAIVAYALSVYLASVIERWAQPHTHLAWIAAAISSPASSGRTSGGRSAACSAAPNAVVEVMWVATSGVLAAVVLIAALSGHAAPGPASGAVLAMAGLAWCAETARFRRPHYLPAASAALAAAAGLFVWSASSRVAGGLAAAVAGAVLALAPLALRRKAEWRLWWSLGAAVAAAAGVIGAFFAPWSATLALAALAAALAGPALLGLPVLAGPSAFVAFAAVCSLESWAGANAWAGTAVAIVAGPPCSPQR